MFAFVLLFILRGSIADGHSGHWGYGEGNGPENWGGTCIDGFRQSPIDIRAADVDYALLHRMHFIHYDSEGLINIVNNGHTVKGDGFEKWGHKQPYIQGGGLRHRYKLVQFHLHWAQHDHHGSEHKIGGLHYPAEVHLVHVRHDLSLNEALRKSDGLAVLGVFVLIGHDGSALAKFSPSFEDVVFLGNRSTVEGFRARALLPALTDAFYRYHGSLTTPECNEAVIWTVFSEPISMTRLQMREIRRLHSSEGVALQHNVRPAQPLNGRRVLYKPSSFDKKLLCGGISAARIITALTSTIVFSIFYSLSI